jgi:hypothetical protein
MLVQPQPAATLGTLDLARRAIRPWNRAQTSDPNELDALQLTPEFEHAQVSVHRGTPELSGRRLRVRRRRQALLCGLGNRKCRKQPPFANGDIGRRLLEKGLITDHENHVFCSRLAN